MTAKGLVYIIFSSVGIKVKLVRDKSSTLAVAPNGGKCRVPVLCLKTNRRGYFRLLAAKMGVEFEISGK
jgi:hypothetical protein